MDVVYIALIAELAKVAIGVASTARSSAFDSLLCYIARR
jgi:hypothetical protein